ncbi:MAG: fatty acid--CoA ligase family protein, partial [Sphingobium sp.]
LAEELGLTIAAIPFNLRDAVAHPSAATGSRTLRMLIGQVPRRPEFLSHVEMTGGYGATEMCGQSLALRGRDGAFRPGLLGRLINGYAARIVDTEGQPVAPGEVGELLIRGPAVTRGYWRMPEATAALLEGGWLHSGDLVRADADGLFYFVDRLKDMIKTGGENVYAAEVEAILNAHPDIVEAAVFGVPDARWGQAVKAVVVSRATGEPEALARTLDAWCLERLAPYKRPRWFEFTTQLPRNATAKITKPPLIAAHDPATSIRLSER